MGLERWLRSRALAAVPEDLGSIPSTHTVAHNSKSRSRGSNALTHTGKIPISINKDKLIKPLLVYRYRK